MAIKVDEKFRSPQVSTGDNARGEISYVVSGTEDRATAQAAMWNAAPTAIDVNGDGSLYYYKCGTNFDRITDDEWEGAVRYAPMNHRIDASGISGETGGGTEHITQSFATRKYCIPGDTPDQAPDFGGAIGVSSDGNVEGVDVPAKQMKFSIAQKLTDAQVTNELLGLLFDLCVTVNEFPWRGFAAGEVLFLDATYSRGPDGNWDFIFYFQASPNRQNIYIGQSPFQIGPITKGGWEYMWIRYREIVDRRTGVTLGKRPVAVYVETVFECRDFSRLPIIIV
jgi:hypothetical protein